MSQMCQQRNYFSASKLLAEYDLPLAVGDHIRSAIMRTLNTLSTEVLLGFLSPTERELTISHALERLPRKTLVAELLRRTTAVKQQTPDGQEFSSSGLESLVPPSEQPELLVIPNAPLPHDNNNNEQATTESDSTPEITPDIVQENTQLTESYTFKAYKNVKLAKRHLYSNRTSVVEHLSAKKHPFPLVCTNTDCTLCASIALTLPLTLCKVGCHGNFCYQGLGCHPPQRTLDYVRLLHKRDRLYHVMCPGAESVADPDVVGYMYDNIHDDEEPNISIHFRQALDECRRFMLRSMNDEAVTYESDCSEAPQHDVGRKRKTCITGSVSTCSRNNKERGNTKKSRK